ncbi:threonine(-3-)dehydrogenase [Legionella wadsworthii]|uniref:Threonine(-3-)dehydrogenase n=1 Tax=Legionella wadsworthii TaxID=28088 RepID=A0A378LQ14_9GAMM|nr:zinc-binding alcohol dehydrogenase [Legionella wadsworthii]STY28450.1 threonine(-3-)dehydrogenase [Legionella wadsworthii]
MKNHVLYFNKPHQVSVREESVPKPKMDEVLVQNVLSGISSGTEMLFYRGLIPTDLCMDEKIPSLNHQLNYPCKYGYCSVGKVVGIGHKKLSHLLDQWVFVFNPHERYFCAHEQQIRVLPPNLSPQDALFIPNMETAINLILDGSPLIGENVLILGLGIVGLLTTALLQQFPLTSLAGVDLYEKRRNLCRELGAEDTFDATHANLSGQLNRYLEALKQNTIDLIYELTGNPQALNTAISLASYEGRIVLGSWYGSKSCAIDLGGRFHRNRIKVIASQVSTIASELQGRWSKERRFHVVFKMLEKIRPSRFISHNFHITDANKAYQLLDSNPDDTLLIALTYEE